MSVIFLQGHETFDGDPFDLVYGVKSPDQAHSCSSQHIDVATNALKNAFHRPLSIIDVGHIPRPWLIDKIGSLGGLAGIEIINDITPNHPWDDAIGQGDGFVT